MKICRVCKNSKPLAEFYRDKSRREGIQGLCKRCSESAKMRVYYGIGMDEFDTLLKDREGRCEICAATVSRQGKRLVLDHCHATGAVRGILCDACNIGIGNLRDDPTLCLNAAKYLIQRTPCATK